MKTQTKIQQLLKEKRLTKLSLTNAEKSSELDVEKNTENNFVEFRCAKF